jgi:GNAT superfamily N-acetyltransferase
MYALRAFTAADLPAARALSDLVGWPHRLEDWRFVLPLGQGIAATAEGRLVGTAFCWPWGPGHATLGLIVVAPAHRGRGLGRRLLAAAAARAGSRILLLHATEDGLPLYRRSGFSCVGTISQHQGAARAPDDMPLPAGDHVRPVARADLSILVELDQVASGLPRAGLLGALMAAADAGTVLLRDGRPAGFAFRRRFGQGWVIGPVVAPDPEAARSLIAPLIQPGAFVRLDLCASASFGDWLDGLGIHRVDRAVAMASGTPPQRNGHLRALASQALG